MPNITIDNESSVKDDLGEGDPRMVFSNLIKETLPAEIEHNTRFNKALFLDEQARVKLEKKHLRINDRETVDLMLPPEGQTFQSDATMTDFVLFLQNFKTYEEYHSSYNPSTRTTSTSRELKCSFEFLIWDNKIGKVVSYGRGVSSDTVNLKMNENTWRKAVAGISWLIADHTPFQRPTRS
jgi:hypothetical protein